jgi:hypothetical protein
MSVIDWVRGDLSGLKIPAHGEALRAGGPTFLTEAFHSSGALSADNRVTAITQFEEKLIGGTGRKVILSVAYEKSEAGLPTELFVKFSRNFDDPFRDRLKSMLDQEGRFALLTRLPGFPIAVPVCMFFDTEQESGTGVLITDRVLYGEGGIEPHRQKCMDYEMAAPLEHYQALIRTLARLAGAHKAGRLSKKFDEQFPFNAETSIAADKIQHTEAQLLKKVGGYTDFVAKFPHLLPASITTPAFIEKLTAEIPRFLQHERKIQEFLHGDLDYIALCHWNANIDNGWFWRNADGEFECGLIDWARVGPMTVAQAIWGCISSAEPEFWAEHLDELLALFVAEYRRASGPAIDVRTLKIKLHFVTMVMGLAYLMDAPRVVQKEMPDLATVKSKRDAHFVANETARVQLHALTIVLTQWQSHDFGKVLDDFLRR